MVFTRIPLRDLGGFLSPAFEPFFNLDRKKMFRSKNNVRPIPHFLEDLAVLQAAQPADAQNIKEILNVWAWPGQPAGPRRNNQLPSDSRGRYFPIWVEEALQFAARRFLIVSPFDVTCNCDI